MEASLNTDYGKMGFGIMRYSEHPIACIIDSENAGQTVREAVGQPFDFPIVATVEEAFNLGAEIFVLGLASSGGEIPDSWNQPIEQALRGGMSLINGLHDRCEEKYGYLIDRSRQEIWDVRVPNFIPKIAMARAAKLQNKRVLMVGTDMAVGKMTTGLEIHKWVKQQGVSTEFLATGQIGITVTGKGIPLDAFIVDRAAGAVETLVMTAADKDIVFIEGQGSLGHPGSTATLPLMRGSCATHLILCHRANMTHVMDAPHVPVPDLKKFIELNEALTGVCGSLIQAKTIGISLNTFGFSQAQAIAEIDRLEAETGLPVTDVIRFGAEKLGRALVE